MGLYKGVHIAEQRPGTIAFVLHGTSWRRSGSLLRVIDRDPVMSLRGYRSLH